MPRAPHALPSDGRRKVTIRDVARAAGVSIATVSYVLNETPDQTVREQTRERVREAAASLGYVPHGVARALREGRSRIVLLNVGSLLGGHSLDSFISGMSEELRALEHSLLVTAGSHAGLGGVPQESLDAIAPRAVLDLPRLITGPSEDDSVFGPNSVFGAIGGHRTGLAFHTLTQLRHLLERGHRDIAFALPVDAGATLAAVRAEHVARVARELGLGPVQTLRIDMGDDPESRRSAVRALVDQTPVTAIAAYSDDVALGVLGAMAGLGLRAPDDLAVIGFDDGRHGQLWQPALTTVRIDAAAFGRRAARVALGLDPGEWVEAPSRVIVLDTA